MNGSSEKENVYDVDRIYSNRTKVHLPRVGDLVIPNNKNHGNCDDFLALCLTKIPCDKRVFDIDGNDVTCGFKPLIVVKIFHFEFSSEAIVQNDVGVNDCFYVKYLCLISRSITRKQIISSFQ